MMRSQTSIIQPAELLQKLIGYDTTNPPGNEAQLIAYLQSLFNQVGLETKILAKNDKRPNLYVRFPGRGEAPPLLMYGHVDVVTTAGQQWAHPPFEGRLIDGYVWGRGAVDMKGPIAIMVSAILQAKMKGFVPAGDILFIAQADEEARSEYGAKFLVTEHKELFNGVRYALGEFGGFSFYISGRKFFLIQVAEKQVCWMKTTLHGPAGHAALPARDAAMGKLGKILMALENRRLPVHITPPVRMMVESLSRGLPFPQGFLFRQLLTPVFTNSIIRLMGETGRLFSALSHNTVNATIVRGGNKVNVIPGEITLELDGRLLPGFTPQDMFKELYQIIGKDVELELVQYDPGREDVDLGLFGFLSGVLKEIDPTGLPVPYVLTGVTDACFFDRLGIQSYGFTPMNLPPGFDFFNVVHAANERIPVDALDFGVRSMLKVIEKYH